MTPGRCSNASQLLFVASALLKFSAAEATCLGVPCVAYLSIYLSIGLPPLNKTGMLKKGRGGECFRVILSAAWKRENRLCSA